MVQPTREDRVECMCQALRLERPRRMPCSDWVMLEYRPDVYHLGEGEPVPAAGQVGVTRDGNRRVTRDGGVWATDAKEKYQDYTDVLDVDIDAFDVEDVGEPMLSSMACLMTEHAGGPYRLPHHYGTLITRATIEFGWESFLMALALEPERFARILDRFGEASLAVARGWAQTEGTELITIHDDIAATRGPMIRPEFCRRYVFPWYERIFAAIHEQGRRVLYISDGNYLDVLEDLVAVGPDGFYIESSSMDPEVFMRRAGRDKLFLIKTNSQAIDVGTPDEIRAEVMRLRDLHREFPGMMIYRGGGNPKPENAEAFQQSYDELLVYR